MGLFNEFENTNTNNNNNRSIENKINQKEYLNNNEKNLLKANHKLGRNALKRANLMVEEKLRTKNLSKLDTTPLQLGFFNSLINGDFNSRTKRIDLVHIFNKSPHARRRALDANFDIEISSIKLYYGRMKVGAEHALTGKFGNLKNNVNYTYAQISGRIFSDGTEPRGITFKIYNTGKIHFSGGILNNDISQPAKIRKHIVDNYTKKEQFLYNPIKYNNTVGTFKVNGVINLSKVSYALRKSGKTEYEPELRAALKMKYLGYSFQLFTSGNIQILGINSLSDMNMAYNAGVALSQELYIMGFVSPRTTALKLPAVKKRSKEAVTTDKSLSNIGYNIRNTVKEPKKTSKKFSNDHRIKVGKKVCSSYPKQELVAVAKKIGVVDIKSTTTREQICQKIRDRVFGNFKVKNKPCLAYTKAQLVPIAVAKGISVSDNDTVDVICRKLNITPPKAPTKKNIKQKKKQNNKVVKNKQTLEKRRLTNKAIKEDLIKMYGKRWMTKYKNVMPSINSDVSEIKKLINSLSLKKNKSGIPLKMQVNELKKNTVQTWKMNRMRKLDNKLNALNNNFAKNLEKGMNVASPKNKNNNKNKKTRFPKGTVVEQL